MAIEAAVGEDVRGGVVALLAERHEHSRGEGEHSHSRDTQLKFLRLL